MKPAPRWWSIRRLLGIDVEADARAEIENHIELRAEELIRKGMPAEEARAEARRRFGDMERVRREVEEIDRSMERRERASSWVDDLRRDLWFSFRGLRRNPGFTAAAVLTLGLAIGANTAVFSSVADVLLRPLPLSDPARLVMLWEENPEREWVEQTAAPANFLDWRERVPAFSDIGAYADFSEGVSVGGAGGPPQVLTARMTTGNLFSVLGVEPAAGRLMTWEETWQGTTPSLMLSHGAWTRLFAADPSIVGGMVRVDGESWQVAGVLPESFELPGVEADLWMSIQWAPDAVAQTSFRRAHWIRPIGRLAPGATPEVARQQLTQVMAELEAEYPETNRMMGAGFTPLHDFLVGDRRGAMVVLFAAVGLLLLLACANVGNLMLVRALGRRRELAVRTALGAGRRRLIRQTMVESAVLAALGTAVGVGIGALLLRLLGISGLTADLAPAELTLDPMFLGYIVAVAAVAALLFGLIPALLAAGSQPLGTLREGGRGMSGGRKARRIAVGLVTAEVALSLVLLIGASLLGRSYLQLLAVDPGFEPEGILTASISLPGSRYSEEALTAFYPRLIDEMGALPGASEVGLIRQLPLTEPSWTSPFSIEGRGPDEYGVEVLHREVAGSYFEALRIPVLRGRTFTASDDARAARVLLINETVAEAHFPGQDPLGQRIAFTSEPTADSDWWTVVGVVGAERQDSPAAEPRMEVFAPLAQDPTGGVTMVMRTESAPASLAPAVRRMIAELDPELGLYDVRTMEEVAGAATAREQFLALLLSAFGGIALVLAVVGVYGVMAQSVRQRRHEIGIRMALGAARAQIVGMITRQTVGVVGLGIAAGLVVSFVAGRGIGALLYGVSPLDPVSWVAAPALLLLAGLAAAALPAARAGDADAAQVLRDQ